MSGTVMPVPTHSDVWPVYVMGLGDPMKVREKKSPNGRPTFSSGGLLKLLSKDGSTRSDKTASVHVLNMNEMGSLEAGQLYRAEGKIWFQPYESNQRVAYSITVEHLVEVEA